MPSPGLQYGKVVRLVSLVADIFRICLEPGSYSKEGMDLKHTSYGTINDMVIPFQIHPYVSTSKEA